MSGTENAKKMPLWLRILIIVGAVLIVLGAAFFIYVSGSYPASETALRALEGGGTVRVTREKDVWFFDGPGSQSALIFYPGGKVACAAYAPLMDALAREGLDCFLVEMPFDLAVFGMDRASRVLADYNYDHWFIGGHSLGGAMAGSFASKHLAELDGIVLLAAYSTAPLEREGFSALVLYGSEDGVMNRESLEKYRENLPKDCTELVLEGGNHAWFGSYGEQKGDGTATIRPEEQWKWTVKAVLELVARKTGAGLTDAA